jgi:hypothetical protein
MAPGSKVELMHVNAPALIGAAEETCSVLENCTCSVDRYRHEHAVTWRSAQRHVIFNTDHVTRAGSLIGDALCTWAPERLLLATDRGGTVMWLVGVCREYNIRDQGLHFLARGQGLCSRRMEHTERTFILELNTELQNSDLWYWVKCTKWTFILDLSVNLRSCYGIEWSITIELYIKWTFVLDPILIHSTSELIIYCLSLYGRKNLGNERTCTHAFVLSKMFYHLWTSAHN